MEPWSFLPKIWVRGLRSVLLSFSPLSTSCRRCCVRINVGDHAPAIEHNKAVLIPLSLLPSIGAALLPF
jgi:hypothetical protein